MRKRLSSSLFISIPLVIFFFLFSSTGYAERLFLYRPAGTAEIGRIDANGKYQKVRGYDGFSPSWGKVVPIGNFLFFYNSIGKGLLGKFDSNGNFQVTQRLDKLGRSWEKIVVVGRYLLFYSSSGAALIAFVSDRGLLQETQRIGNFTSNWTNILAIGKYIFFASEGIGAVGFINGSGQFQQTDSISNLGFRVSNSAVVGGYLYLYSAPDGFASSGKIDSNGKYQGTWIGPANYQNWQKIVPVGNRILSYINSGQAQLGFIDKNNGGYWKTEDISNFTSDWTNIVAVGNYLFFYRYDGIGAVGTISPGGFFQQTQSLYSLPINWNSIVVIP
jgi:hypothetical protein